jgi:hypothetical protein
MHRPQLLSGEGLGSRRATVAAKPELVQISTSYGGQKEGSTVLPRNKYTAIRDDKPKSKDDAKRPEFKVCKFTTEAIITEAGDVGTLHKVCANPTCPVHHPKQPTSRNDEKWKAERDKQRKEQARQHDRPPCPCRCERRRSCSAHETRPAFHP